MYPLDLEEFATALGINDKIIETLRNHLQKVRLWMNSSMKDDGDISALSYSRWNACGC